MLLQARWMDFENFRLSLGALLSIEGDCDAGGYLENGPDRSDGVQLKAPSTPVDRSESQSTRRVQHP